MIRYVLNAIVSFVIYAALIGYSAHALAQTAEPQKHYAVPMRNAVFLNSQQTIKGKVFFTAKAVELPVKKNTQVSKK